VRWAVGEQPHRLTLRRDRLEAFRERFAAVARESLTDQDLGPEQRVDLVLDLADVNPDLERLCRHLEPCGMGNPGPVFGARGIRLDGARRVGSGHLKGTLAAPSGRLAAIGFNWADRAPKAELLDVAFRLEQNEWQGEVSLQARIVALTQAGEAELPVRPAAAAPPA
jgi:single-stranded-DNA-specific exonuclease